MRGRRIIGTSLVLIGTITVIKLVVNMERDLADARMQARMDSNQPRLFDQEGS